MFFGIFIIIFLCLLELASILALYFVGAVAIIFQLVIIVFTIIFIVKYIKYINENKNKIKNSKITKKVLSISKILLKIGIIIAIISVILLVIYKIIYTPKLEDYLGKYEEDIGDWWHYDLTIEKNNRCSFTVDDEDIDDFGCSYDYNNNNTLTLTIYDKEENESYDFICEYEFKTIINNMRNDYLYCSTDSKTKNIRPIYSFDNIQ